MLERYLHQLLLHLFLTLKRQETGFWNQEWFVASVKDVPCLQMFGNIVKDPVTNVLFDIKSEDKCDF